MQNTDKCKGCGVCGTEPILDYVPVDNGSFSPEAMDVVVVGYEEYCEGCYEALLA